MGANVELMCKTHAQTRTAAAVVFDLLENTRHRHATGCAGQNENRWKDQCKAKNTHRTKRYPSVKCAHVIFHYKVEVDTGTYR